MTLLALSLAPSIAIIIFIIGKDQYNKEPYAKLFISFLLGVVSTFPAVIIQLTVKSRLVEQFAEGSLLFYAFFAFAAVAFSEEFSKFLMLRYYAYQQKEFDEPLDGIIYSVMIGMGFATVENILYVMQYGFGTAIARMFLAVPAHACFAVMMGYYAGLAKFNQAKSPQLLFTGLMMAILFHGAYDFFLFIQKSDSVTQFVSEGLLSLGALVSLYIALKISLRSIHLHQELSRIEFNRREREEV